ncbi:MAG: Xaa-Pro aminopeptidase [Bacteroidales bacterium]|nr:Xaa-Pro aminopeptidase [Bacteroidales bacterium]MDD4216655.1 Xaa-Pro aminopeptidase [Bacteroidales bacterium]MDY0141515.1 Xaa-Pro aminopeptidase [Bacteroidales bacterium]
MQSNFNSKFFTNNRQNLFTEILPNSLVVLFSAEQFPKNGDQYYKYRQNSDTFYYSGLTQENTTILLYKAKESKSFTEFAFIIEPNQKMLTWIGHKYSKDEAAKISGIENIEFQERFDEVFQGLIKKPKNLYFSHNSNIRGIQYSHSIFDNWIDSVKSEIENHNVLDLDPLTMDLRLIKSPIEQNVMQKAIDITGKTFRDILKFVKPDVYEYQVEAEILKGFFTRGANDYAYPSIVASGKNNNILHYNTNRNKCNVGDLLLLDFGAELEYYAADVSRTIPVSGKFTSRQKEVYKAVLDVHKQIKNKIIPGNTIRQLNLEAQMLIQDALLKLKLISRFDIATQKDENPAFKKYYMHGVSHFIGLDVHDVGNKDTVLQTGMILSCEPGIYIEDEGFGIRIENDIMVANTPIDMCSNIPIEADEIEQIMSS